MTIRYISVPSAEQVEEVKSWIRKNLSRHTDSFDMAVDCCHDLEIFDWDEHEVDPRQTHPIASWIGELCEDAFNS